MLNNTYTPRTVTGTLFAMFMQRQQQCRSLNPDRLPLSGLPRSGNHLKPVEPSLMPCDDPLPPFKLDRHSDSNEYTLTTQMVTEVGTDDKPNVSREGKRRYKRRLTKTQVRLRKSRKQLKLLKQIHTKLRSEGKMINLKAR